MEAAERPSSGYTLGPPWLFKGSALYQLHLVKAETARAFIPKELRLVEAFGYTLGGLFLAHYDDSPAGRFDELVVIAGIVWNPPTSCAWAARVLVNSYEACGHGRKEIGLPSHVAVFSKRKMEIMEKSSSRQSSFLNMIGMSSAYCKSKEHGEIQVSEIKGSSQMSICNINLPFVVPKSKTNEKCMGPMIRMSLPSFSGQTEHNPQLLKYSCQIECRSALTVI
ncbi:protein NEOXANTHIN-DEFICIENT 1 isoform X2 [Phoenix dactylifera]|uniref:Protein NEOXANTHIN-DEFICIENT 1 isoform X2 n=1 Tax=Phoenix dactylifera TaxID=42345 RepID=A0A8B8JC84_PHODC|nr:protein NEOXANTHIN-DEFICIENT 1 isoform X2 [Phoenix dactylifera]